MAELSIASFMSSLRSQQTPAVLWYGAPGERIELSGRVLDNWVSKSANFFCEELELDLDATVQIPPSNHWRTLVLVLAALRAGITLSNSATVDAAFGFQATDFDEVSAETYTLVDTGALALRFMGHLPDHIETLDYTAQVRSFADVYMGINEPTYSSPAVAETSHQHLWAQVKKLSEQLVAEVPQEIQALEVRGSLTSVDVLIQVLATLIAGFAVLLLDDHEDFESLNRSTTIYADERAQLIP